MAVLLLELIAGLGFEFIGAAEFQVLGRRAVDDAGILGAVLDRLLQVELGREKLAALEGMALL